MNSYIKILLFHFLFNCNYKICLKTYLFFQLINFKRIPLPLDIYNLLYYYE